MSEKSIIKVETVVVNQDQIERRIYVVRGHKVMLDGELALLYGVTTSAMNRAVRRNIDRFPEDFIFQLSESELESLKCQIGISKTGRGGRRYMPYVFTEQGVAMLSSVLNSDRAVQVNIAIMRAFVNMRKLIATNAEITKKTRSNRKTAGLAR